MARPELISRLSAPMDPAHRKKLVESLATWDFKPHELDDGDLYRVATLLFEAVLGCEGVVELGIKPGESDQAVVQAGRTMLIV